MDKKPLLLNQDFLSSMLLTQMTLGSLAAVLLLAGVPVAFAGMRFMNPNPAPPTLIESIFGWAWSFLPWMYVALFLGGLSAILYTFVVKDADSKVFLRVWGIALIVILSYWVAPSLMR